MPLNSNLKKRLISGLGANVFSQIVTILIQVVSVPLFLSFWGKELYGEWLIISATPMFLSMSDLGFTIAAENAMTMRVAKKDRTGAIQIFQTTWLILIFTSVAIVFFIALLLSLFDLTSILSISQLSNREFTFVFSLLAVYVLLGMQINLLAGGFRCDGNYAKGVCWVNYLRLFDYLSISVALYMGALPLFVAFSFVSTRITGVFLMYAYLRKESQWIEYGYKHFKLSTIRNLLKPALASMGLPITNAISNQGTILIIGSLLTPVDVVLFSTLRTLSRFALQMMRTIRATITPELSIAYATDDLGLARKIHRSSCQASFWLSLIAVLFLSITGDWILRIWTKNNVEMNLSLYIIMLFTVVIGSFWYTSFAVLTSVNLHHEIVPKYFLVTFLCLSCSIFVIPILGIDSAGICLMVIEVITSYLVLQKSLALLNENVIFYFRKIITPPFDLLKLAKL